MVKVSLGLKELASTQPVRAGQLDDGTVWPTSYAITELSSADEKLIAALVREAIGD